MKMKRTALGAAVAVAMGVSALPANAAIVKFSWDGAFTMINPLGVPLVNSDSAWLGGSQTLITGTMVFNNGTAAQTTVFDGVTTTYGPGAGAATVASFSFFGGGNAIAHDIVMQAIGDGHGLNGDTTGIANGPGFLVGANMLFDWSGTTNINVDLVMNAGGFFTAGPPGTDGVLTMGTGAIANPFEPICTSSYLTYGCANELNHGDTFMATIDGNPFGEESVTILSTGGVTLAANINRHTDGLTGIRMDNGPFPNFNANFDVWDMTNTGFEPPPPPIPVPAAVWLFGSGLLGLVGVARRKKTNA